MFSERTRWNRRENRLALALSDAQAAGHRILDLTRSNPTECGFRYEQHQLRKAISHSGILGYAPEPKGLLPAREEVATYYAARDQLVPAENLILTSGTSEGYSFLFRLLCNAGGEVLIPSPGYPLFDFLADLSDVKLVRYTMFYDHGWQIDFVALEGAISKHTRAVIVVHPNNPTGHFVNPTEQGRLADLCQKRRLALIVDEVFLDFALDVKPASFVGTPGLTFVLSGLSKICGLPQMKLAWIAVSGDHEQRREALARLELISDAYLSVSTPVQLAATELLGTRTAFQSQAMERIRQNLAELDQQLGVQNKCSRLVCEGGWTAVLRVPALQSDEDLAIALLRESGVYVHPGYFYDFAGQGYVVASLLVPPEEFSEGVQRLLAHFP